MLRIMHPEQRARDTQAIINETIEALNEKGFTSTEAHDPAACVRSLPARTKN
jgi:hypothetical protein